MFKKLIAAASVLVMLLLLVTPALALSQGMATTTADWLNFRSAPGMSGRVIDLIPCGSEVDIIQDMDDWCLIEWNGVYGYVASQYLAQEFTNEGVPASRASGAATQGANTASEDVTFGLILGDEVRFRKVGSLTSDVIGFFYRGIIVKVLEEATQWTKVEFRDEIGYVSSQYVRVGTPTAEEFEAAENANYIGVWKASVTQTAPSVSVQSAPAAQPTTQANTPQQPVKEPSPAVQEESFKCISDDIIASAKACLGVPYQSGGASMKGFDCSGFTSFVFAQNGISLSRTATAQYKQGTYVSKSDLLPGDLVFFSNDGTGSNIEHVGIYIGDGKLIHASSGAHKMIVIAEMDSSWFVSNYFGACRILK